MLFLNVERLSGPLKPSVLLLCLTRENRALGNIRKSLLVGNGLLLLLLSAAAMLLSGCGAYVVNSGASAADTSTLAVTPSDVAFGEVAVGTTVDSTVTLGNPGTAAVEISDLSVTGSSFTLASGTTLPITLAVGESTTVHLQFSPKGKGAVKGQLQVQYASATTAAAAIEPQTVTSSASKKKKSTSVGLTGTGSTTTTTVTGLSCTSAALTGAGTDACTVTLSAAAASSGQSVTLASNDAAVTVPSSVKVAAGATTANFTATVAAVTTTQTATLTATSGGATQSFAIQLSAGSVATLAVNATSVAFGSVNLNTTATQTVTLSSTGTTAVSISSVTLAGTGFSIASSNVPTSLSPGQTASVSVAFDPTTSGAATGTLTIASNSSTGSTTQVALTGTGVTYAVNLSWNAPTSTGVTVASYNVYRATGGVSSYSLLASAKTSTAYTDAAVQGATSYAYYVTSVATDGTESVPSNTTAVTIP